MPEERTAGRAAELSEASTVRELVPGDPDGLDALARAFDRSALGASDVARRLRALPTAGWTGPAADAFHARLGELPARLDAAADAFGAAARELRAHADELRTARRDAGRALELLSEAALATARWRFDAGFAARLPGAADPGDPLRAQARQVLETARDRLHAQARRSADRLAAAADAAPDRPSWLARALHHLEEFFSGAAEATLDLAAFGFGTSPAYLLVNPDGYVANAERAGTGVALAVADPRAFVTAFLDADTWRDSPARALGHLVPDLVATLVVPGAVGAVRAMHAARTLDDAAAAASARDPLFPAVPAGAAEATVRRLGLDPGTPAGRAAVRQLQPPYGQVDDWRNVTLPAGTAITFGHPGISGFGLLRHDAVRLGTHSRRLFEGVQVAPLRVAARAAPTYRPETVTYITTRPVEAAASTATANRQFGRGGRPQVYVDFDDLVRSSALVEDGDARTALRRLTARIEDPRYTAVAPDLPATRPLTVRGAALGATPLGVPGSVLAAQDRAAEAVPVRRVAPAR